MKKSESGLPLNAVYLRLLALICMLLDHLWGTVVPGNWWMTCVGRLAFPIFAFQIVEGYYHTSNLKDYMKRLLIFGLVSEIPFNLMLGGSWFYPFHQNVMFTMLLGLLAIRAMEQAMEAPDFFSRMRKVLLLLMWCVLGAIVFVDYGFYGVLTVLLFAVCRRLPYTKLFQLAGMIAIHVFMMEGMQLQILNMEFPLQGFAVLALIPIWLYNGEKGPRNRAVQYSSYVFYPLHMLILGVIGRFF